MSSQRGEEHRDPFDGVAAPGSPGDAVGLDVLDAFPATLPEESVPAGSWQRLAAAVAAEPRLPRPPLAHELPAAPAGRAGWRRWRPAGPFATAGAWLGAVAAVAVIAVGGAFAGMQAARLRSLESEQALLASWMSDPEMHLVALQAPAGAAGAPPTWPDDWHLAEYDGSAGRLGIVCVLPDGRALVFLAQRAPRRAEYVVLGGEGGQVELARGQGNLLQFEAGTSDRVSVRLLTAAGDVTPVAWAQLR